MNKLKEFDKELEKLNEFEVVKSLPIEIQNMLVNKIHEVRILCKKYKLPPIMVDSIMVKFIFDLEANFGYELLIQEENINNGEK